MRTKRILGVQNAFFLRTKRAFWALKTRFYAYKSTRSTRSTRKRVFMRTKRVLGVENAFFLRTKRVLGVQRVQRVQRENAFLCVQNAF